MTNAKLIIRPLILVGTLIACAAIGYGVWALVENQWTATWLERAGHRSEGHFKEGFWWTERYYTAIVGWPTQPPTYHKPVFLLFVHYPPGMKSSDYSIHNNQMSEDDWDIGMEATAEFKDGRRFVARYAVSANDPIEKFEVDGRVYSAEAGRVFLVDLTGTSPAVKQRNFDLTKLMSNPASESQPISNDQIAQLRVALAKLRAEEAEVRSFLGERN